MARRHNRPRRAGPEERQLSEGAAALMRAFNDDLHAIAKAYNEAAARLQSRYARQLAKIDKIDLDSGWALDPKRMRWVQVPQQGGPGQ